MFYFTPLPGFFSPFPHGTVSLSVTKQYLALWGGPHFFIRDFPCLALLWILPCLSIFHILDFHYLWFAFPNNSVKSPESIMQSITPVELLLLVQALPLSLATTQGIEFSFFSCRYLDVSVPCVPLLYTTLLMYGLVSFFPDQSFLIRISVDIMDICSSPQLFAAYHVLLRLLVPRHPPYALYSLISCFISNINA